MPIRGYIIEKYNAMTNAYTCNRLVQEASAMDMDLQIVGIHDTTVSMQGIIIMVKYWNLWILSSTAINGDGKRML